MKQNLWLVVVLFITLSQSCKKETPTDRELSSGTTFSDARFVRKDNANLKIAVVSDVHYAAPSLFTNNGAAGLAFQNYLDMDPKLLEYSDPIFRTVMAQIKQELPDILLIPGDLTKDGEKVSHEAMADFLTQLRDVGIKVYVLPGNHDINNAKAARYDGDNSYSVATIHPADFSSIYTDFGYGNALYRDVNSLSYVVQPYDSLWILAIDASTYEDYGPGGDVADGRIKPQTLSWIVEKLALAREQHMTVLAMMHHNLVEHYAGQTQLDAGYVIDDWQNVANTLMEAGINIIFTGHYHANDITPYVHNGKKLYDIETGSLVTPPSPYRIVMMKNKKLDISTTTIQSINASLPGGMSFPVYSDQFLTQHLLGYFQYLLTNKFGVPEPVATIAAPLFTNAVKAHFAGDEKMPPEQRMKIDELATISQQLAGMVTTLWTDLGEKDNKVPIAYNK